MNWERIGMDLGGLGGDWDGFRRTGRDWDGFRGTGRERKGSGADRADWKRLGLKWDELGRTGTAPSRVWDHPRGPPSRQGALRPSSNGTAPQTRGGVTQGHAPSGSAHRPGPASLYSRVTRPRTPARGHAPTVRPRPQCPSGSPRGGVPVTAGVTGPVSPIRAGVAVPVSPSRCPRAVPAVSARSARSVPVSRAGCCGQGGLSPSRAGSRGPRAGPPWLCALRTCRYRSPDCV